MENVSPLKQIVIINHNFVVDHRLQWMSFSSNKENIVNNINPKAKVNAQKDIYIYFYLI